MYPFIYIHHQSIYFFLIFILTPLSALSLAARQTAGGGEAAGRGARSSQRTEATVGGETKRPRAASSRPAAQAVPCRRTGALMVATGKMN